ncbi:lysosomal aspartic protease-like [Cylas formicarius]|uniref:lysosomal aspartic protease-like n=1 Tax=Cylas formicarius TaxID=197179 RepID=UPI002958720B|nr:lysosomal aspartic protease-like [Cylas formicarius]
MVFKVFRMFIMSCVISNICNLAARTEEQKGFTIELKRIKSPFEQHLNAPNLTKYGINLDWFYQKSSQTNDSIALYRYLDNEFYGEIVVGKPGQKFNVAFDTSYPISWVLSARCFSWTNWGCMFHNKYDDTKSSTFQKDGRPYVADDGQDKFTGIYAYEKISFAHSNVTNQSFVEMEQVPRSLIFSKIDGILGLGQKFNDSYQPFFYTLMNQSNIPPLFSIYLNRDRQSNKGGNIMLGFINKKHIRKHMSPNNIPVEDEIRYLSVEPSFYWQFKIDGILLNDTKSPVKLCDNGCTGITDTSSNKILGPKEEVDEIHRVLKARPFFLNRWRVDCDTVNKLPKLFFTLGGEDFDLKGTDYTTKMSYFSFTICLSAFVPQEMYPDNFWVLGGAFLSQIYTIYNVEEKQIGFVRAA